MVAASLITWGPTLVQTSTAALATRHTGNTARSVTGETGGGAEARTKEAARQQRTGRADRGARRAPALVTGASGAATGSPTTAGTGETATDSPSSPAHTTVTEEAPAATAGTGPAPDPDGRLGDVTFYGPNAGAAHAAAQPGVPPADAALLAELAEVPTATWLGQWSGDVAATVRGVVADARAAGGVPVFVAYNIPGRDCGGYSAGGEGSVEGYLRWVEGIATGIGAGEAVVVVEPDALAQLCGDPAERYRMLRAAVDVLERNPGTHTYLDAGHADWIDAPTMAGRLRTAGVTGADGFALNVSNFGTTAANVAYGRQLSSLLSGAHFVVDTSRNGNGPGSDWCNPPGRAVGERPTARTGQDVVDAYLWIKTPGESDGTCNGGPSAGVFWPEYALGLLRATP